MNRKRFPNSMPEKPAIKRLSQLKKGQLITIGWVDGKPNDVVFLCIDKMTGHPMVVDPNTFRVFSFDDAKQVIAIHGKMRFEIEEG